MGIQLPGADKGPLKGHRHPSCIACGRERPRLRRGDVMFGKDDVSGLQYSVGRSKNHFGSLETFLTRLEFPAGDPSATSEDPALILRADTIAPVFNDEEKRAGAAAQVHKLAREGYRFDVGGWHFGQGVTGRPPWSLGLGMLGVSRTECAS